MLFLLLFSFYSNATIDHWRCTDQSTTKSGHIWYACGVGLDIMDEGAARSLSMHNAIDEFETMCKLSSDCKGRDKIVEPMRTSCVVFISKLGTTQGFRCYRLIKITVD